LEIHVRNRWIALTVAALAVGATPAVAAKRETALRSVPRTATPAKITPAAGPRTALPVAPVTRPTVRPGIKWTTRGVRTAVWIR
jgi:hypothetical protein